MEQEKAIVVKAIAISAISLNPLGIKSVDTQNSDQLDFHDLSVGSVRSALDEAYEAGKAAGKKNNTDGHQK